MARSLGSRLGGRFVLCAAALLGLTARAQGVEQAVFGYVPEYRFETVDWDAVLQMTTHVVLFSIEPTAEGDLAGMDRLQGLVRNGSPFRASLQRIQAGPRILVSIGGSGRSTHFPAVTANKQARRKLAKNLAKLLTDVPIFWGIDIDWESPANEDQWRNLGKLAKDIRAAYAHASQGQKTAKDHLLLTFTYHPGTGAVQAFAGLKGKKSERSFTDMFDYAHAMAYSQFDQQRRHSSLANDLKTIEEWAKNGLHMRQLTLGIPFFGVDRKTGQTITYGEIMDNEPSLYDRPKVDETSSGIYFVNAMSMAKKVDLVKEKGIAGIMIWELGQDKPTASGRSMLPIVANAVKGVQPGAGMWQALSSMSPVSENQVFLSFAVIIGSYLLLRVLVGKPPPAYIPPQRPLVKAADGPPGVYAGGEMADPAAEGEDEPGAEDEGAEDGAGGEEAEEGE